MKRDCKIYMPSKRSMLFIVLITSASLFSSCHRKLSNTTVYHKDSTTVLIKDTIINIPGTTIRQTINIDSLVKMIKAGIKPGVITKPIVITDTSMNAELRLIIDQYGNITAECIKKDEFIKAQQKEIKQLREAKVESTGKEIPLWVKVILMGFIAIFILLLLIIILILIRKT